MLKVSVSLLLFFLFFQNTALSVKIEIFDETQQDYVGGNAVYKVLTKDYKGPGTEYKIKAEGISHTLQVTKQSFKIQGAGKLESENPVVVTHKSKLKKSYQKF